MTYQEKRAWSAWAEAFAIFARYTVGDDSVSAHSDAIYAGPDPEKVSEEDRARLEVLGWYDSGEECFRRSV